MNYLKKIYRSYRESQKQKGRVKKALKQKNLRMNFYSQFLNSGDLCFDIGANMGNRTEVFLEMGCKVIAVEPQAECVANLREKFEPNPNLIIINKALDKEKGQKEFHISNSNTLSSMSEEWINHAKSQGSPFTNANWDKKIEVETETLDSLINQHGMPQFCKIDVEGFEYNVLQGLSQKVDMVSIEFALGMLNSTIDCIQYLNGLGGSAFNYSLGESMSLELDEYVDKDCIINLLKNLEGDNFSGGDIYIKKC